jgi:hypothetical protein
MPTALYTFLIRILSVFMKQIGTYRVRVSSGVDTKKLSDGSTKKYRYGSITVRTPKLSALIGKIIMIRIFDEGKKTK